jgi:prolyl 4-hydroxylase
VLGVCVEQQVLRYQEGQRYDSHHDFFDPKYYTKDERVQEMIDGGRRNRLITVFW